MIKGVNRQMIEISQTDNPYFEKALLVVRGGIENHDSYRLHEEAERTVKGVGTYSALCRGRRRYWLRRVGWMLAGGSFGLLLGILLGTHFPL